ncbi:MAG: hypothetical protein ABIN97_20315, partial [Ginsengibacter sp.]
MKEIYTHSKNRVIENILRGWLITLFICLSFAGISQTDVIIGDASSSNQDWGLTGPLHRSGNPNS